MEKKFPDGWRVYELGELLNYEQPTPYIVESTDYNNSFQTPVLTAGKSFIIGYTNETTGIYDKLPVLLFDDFTTSSQFVNFKFKVKSSAMKILSANQELATLKFLYYLMQIIDCDHGTHKRYWIPIYSKIKVAIPSLPEQRRIVAKIEELFSELDRGVDELRKVKAQLKVYRQAVLKEAVDFTNSSTFVDMNTICDDIRIGPFGTMLHKSDYISNGVPVINPQHIKQLSIFEHPKITISESKAKQLSAYKLKANDIIMGRRGEMGRAAAICDKQIGWICGTGSILFRLKPEFDSKLYAQILSSPNVVHFLEDNATGTTMKNLNEHIAKHIPVPYLTRHMQNLLMSKIESRLSVCDKIEQTVDESLRKAEHLRQSILRQAFEGKLV